MGGRFPGAVRHALSVAVAVVAFAPHAAVAQGVATVQVKAQPLERSLKEVARQTHTNILFAPETVRAIGSPAIEGRMSALQAVRRLIAGTPLEVIADGSGGLIIRRSSDPARMRPIATSARQPASQNTPPDSEPAVMTLPPDDTRSESTLGPEVVVTGTLIRNTAPTGTDPITVSSAEIQATGASSGSEALASIPQIGGNFFNGIPQVDAANATAAFGFNQTSNRPSLRPNPFGGTDSGNSTLILIDGARQSGIGVNGSSANPDSVPPILIERIEANPDGGSSTYGSDAIGGVINFITKRRFKGIQAGGAISVADDYTAYDANVAAGTEWRSGSAYIAYNFTTNGVILNGQRDYYRPMDFGTGLQRDLACNTANISIPAAGGVAQHYYAAPASGAVSGTPFTVVAPVSGVPNVCSLGTIASLASANRRHNVMARLEQDITDKISVGLRLRYTNESQYGYLGPTTFNVVVNNTNPYFRPIPAAGSDGALTSYSVLGNFGPAFPASRRIFSNADEQYGALADITWNFGKWRFYGFVNFDHSASSFSVPTLNPTALANGFNATATSACSVQRSTAACFNPFDIAASAPALLANLGNYYNIGRSADEIINLRGVFDGPVFDLPGGPLQVAVGFEYLRDDFHKGILSGTDPSLLTQLGVVQQNTSVFGEINLPVFGAGNAMPLLYRLTLSASARYDDYSDFGGTFNPKFGVDYKPVSWLTIRGNWSKSFRAPTTVDLLGTNRANTTLASYAANVFGGFLLDPSKPVPPSTARAITLNGTQSDIGPQRGINWSVGADFTPLKGLKASFTYYRINYYGTLTQPFNGTPIFPNLANLATICPCTQAQVDAFYAKAGSSASVANIALSDIYGLYDSRTDNFGNTRVGGIDYALEYRRPMPWGSLYATAAGSVILLNATQALPGLPYVSNISDNVGNVGQNAYGRSLHRLSLRTGFVYGDFRGEATLNRTFGYDVLPSATLLQSHVDSFNVVNLFFSYAFKGGSKLTDGIDLSLNINNLFDTDPPIERRTNSGNGYINGATLGRLIKISLQKHF